MHLQRTLPHYAKALLSKKTGRTIYHIVSISPSIVINGQETIKGRRKETSGLLSLFNKAYALLPQVLNICPISCCFVSKMSKIFLSPMSSHMLGLCVSRPWLARFVALLYVTTQWCGQEIFQESIAEPSQPTSAYPCRSYQRGQVWIYTTDPQDWSESWGLTSYVSSLWNSYVYLIIPKDSLWVGESEDTEQSLLRLSWERWGHFFIFLITLNFHSASFKGNDFVCFLKLENTIWAYRRQTASTINSALQIHVLKLQLRRKCKKH